MITQPKLSTKVKKQKQTKEFLNANEKCPFEPPSKRETPNTQLSTNHWSSVNQTDSTPEVRENENANKSQEMKVKLPKARKT